MVVIQSKKALSGMIWLFGEHTVEKSTVWGDMAFWGVNSGKKHCKRGIWLFGEYTVEKSTDCSFYSPKSRPPAKATNLRWPSSGEPLWPTTYHSGKKHWAIVALLVENAWRWRRRGLLCWTWLQDSFNCGKTVPVSLAAPPPSYESSPFTSFGKV